ncbi:MAG: DUF2232 domain-containing protein [Pseudanabaenaceae cyanobacterium bins.68]|nr:DUF2232 domain-containing protein [Pseudanabaenaceae cyanobacterium bins.68]
MTKPLTRSLVESAFLASATATIFLINTYFPLGPLIRMLYPIPTALIYLRWGASSAWKTMFVAFLLLSVLMGPLRSIQFLIPFGLMGVMLGHLWQRQVTWFWSIGLGTLVSTLGSIFQLALLSVMVGENLWVYSTVQITGILSWLWQLFGSLDQPELWLVQILAIAAVIFSNLVYQLLVHLAAQFLLERIGNPIPQSPAWLQNLIS